jgi:transcription-repair coupling factor (superfamily II helicase)
MLAWAADLLAAILGDSVATAASVATGNAPGSRP